MALKDVTAEGVKRAVDEFDRLGREAFLAHYGFGRARSYYLVHGGRRYDSKAVVGVAHRFNRPELGPLRSEAFSGGEATVASHLESLGFEGPIRPSDEARYEPISTAPKPVSGHHSFDGVGSGPIRIDPKLEQN